MNKREKSSAASQCLAQTCVSLLFCSGFVQCTALAGRTGARFLQHSSISLGENNKQEPLTSDKNILLELSPPPSCYQIKTMCVAKYKAHGSLVRGLTDQFNAPVPYLKNNVIIYVGLLLLGIALEAKCSFVVQPEISRRVKRPNSLSSVKGLQHSHKLSSAETA